MTIALVTLGGVLLSVEYGRLTSEFYSRMVLSEGRSVRDRLNLHLSPSLSALALTGRLLSQAGPEKPGSDETRALLLSALAEEASLDSAALWDAGGVRAMAVRSGKQYLFHQRGQDGQGPPVWQRLGQDLSPLGEGPPAARELEAQAALIAKTLASDSATWPKWTDVLTLPGGRAGIGAVAPAGPGGDANRAVFFGFGLDKTLNVLRQDLPEEAKVLVCSPDGYLLDTAPGKAPAFVPMSKASDPVLGQALAAWLQGGMPVDAAFGFNAGSAAFWASLQPLAENGARVYAGLAMSREALVAMVLHGGRWPLLVAGGFALTLALLGAIAVQLRRRSHALKPFFETEGEVRELLERGESDRLEFKSTLRFNLAAGKHGKEIEMAVMKTLTAFMNTDGGILAVGVDDQGRPVGMDPDGFENDDHLLRHFSSLFAQHIGVEHLARVRFALREAEGRKVLLIECATSAEPVILKGGKEEEFYVRAGPSSRKLSLSEFMRRVVK